MSRFVCDKCGCIDIVELTYPNGKPPGTPYLCANCQHLPTRSIVQPVPYDPVRDPGAPDIVNQPSGIGLG